MEPTPSSAVSRKTSSHSSDLTPQQIVAELDKYIIGQAAAKRSVSIALRNRWRRGQVPAEIRDEILPKNITMIGPTGCGKTEIARRMARLTGAPFLKVEASKFTEVGYVGRDVESIIRDIAEVGVALVRKAQMESVQDKARLQAEERMIEILVPALNPAGSSQASQNLSSTRERFREKLLGGELDDKQVDLELVERGAPFMKFFPVSGMESMDQSMKDMFADLMPKRSKKRKMPVKEALETLQQEEAEKLLDMDEVVRQGIRNVEQNGIVFLDEVDKIAGRNQHSSGPDISREGVQRDLLPIVEGSTVNTKYGPVRTDHILFIAAGAFHVSKPSDMIPELQGRFPLRVELQPLTKADFVRILSEPRNALTTQYVELLKTEAVELVFTESAIEEIAAIASEVNARGENIGARRLHTIMEKTVEEVSFEAANLRGQTITVTPDYIRNRLGDILADQDLSRYIL